MPRNPNEVSPLDLTFATMNAIREFNSHASMKQGLSQLELRNYFLTKVQSPGSINAANKSLTALKTLMSSNSLPFMHLVAGDEQPLGRDSSYVL